MPPQNPSLRKSMDALLNSELTERREADARVNKRAPVVPKAAKEPKAAKRQAKAPEPEPEEEEEEDWDEDDDDDESEEDDEEDEDLAENGSFTPTVATDPVDAAEAESKVDRRVFLDGVPRRSDLRMGGATILGWRAKKGQWEVECDRYDEHILVSSSCMFFMDLAPSPRKPEPKKAKATTGKVEAKPAPKAAKAASKAKPAAKKATVPTKIKKGGKSKGKK